MRNIIKKLSVCWIALATIGIEASQPGDIVREKVDEVIYLIHGPETEVGSRPERIQSVRQLADQLFDFRAITYRALGRNLRKLSKPELEKLVDLFSDLLFETYYERVEASKDPSVDYPKEIKLADDKYEIQTRVEADGLTVTIDYRLFENRGDWKVYDVVIEGVSLVQNYRQQFDEILRRGNGADLIEKLNDREEI